jgi:hypothetical protein
MATWIQSKTGDFFNLDQIFHIYIEKNEDNNFSILFAICVRDIESSNGDIIEYTFSIHKTMEEAQEQLKIFMKPQTKKSKCIYCGK